MIVISVGELNDNKNNQLIIEAMSKIDNKELHYFICGTGPNKKKLVKQVQERGISDRVHFLGYRTDIADLLCAADIFVMPSLREGLSRSLLEAMACRLPCVVSNIRGNNDLIKNDVGGYLCKSKSVQEFANGLSKLTNNQILRKKMGINNYLYLEKYSIENSMAALKNIYFKI